MHAYAIFAAKKGRPKANLVDQEPNRFMALNQARTAEADVIYSLFALKKISAEDNEAAKFYQILHKKYNQSIGAPVMYSTSLIKISNSKSTSAADAIRPSDEQIALYLHQLKMEFLKVDKRCEEIVYKTVIENQMKYELLNVMNINFNPLKILQDGLKKISEYRTKNKIYKLPN